MMIESGFVDKLYVDVFEDESGDICGNPGEFVATSRGKEHAKEEYATGKTSFEALKNWQTTFSTEYWTVDPEKGFVAALHLQDAPL